MGEEVGVTGAGVTRMGALVGLRVGGMVGFCVGLGDGASVGDRDSVGLLDGR